MRIDHAQIMHKSCTTHTDTCCPLYSFHSPLHSFIYQLYTPSLTIARRPSISDTAAQSSDDEHPAPNLHSQQQRTYYATWVNHCLLHYQSLIWPYRNRERLREINKICMRKKHSKPTAETTMDGITDHHYSLPDDDDTTVVPRRWVHTLLKSKHFTNNILQCCQRV